MGVGDSAVSPFSPAKWKTTFNLRTQVFRLMNTCGNTVKVNKAWVRGSAVFHFCVILCVCVCACASACMRTCVQERDKERKRYNPYVPSWVYVLNWPAGLSVAPVKSFIFTSCSINQVSKQQMSLKFIRERLVGRTTSSSKYQIKMETSSDVSDVRQMCLVLLRQ